MNISTPGSATGIIHFDSVKKSMDILLEPLARLTDIYD